MAALPSGVVDKAKKKAGTGTRMVEDMKKKGKPVTPKMQEMADWLDGLEANANSGGGQPGEVRTRGS